MPRPKGSKNKPKVKTRSINQDTGVIEKPVICGHEEVKHAIDCKQCWQVEKQFCGKRWFRCGGHGEHIELDCQKLCTPYDFRPQTAG